MIRYANAEDKKADLKICFPDGQTFFVDVTIFNPGSRSYQNLSPDSVMRTRERYFLSMIVYLMLLEARSFVTTQQTPCPPLKL